MTALPKMGKSQKRKKRVNKQKRREKRKSNKKCEIRLRMETTYLG
jgi:hypothetical protein